MNQYIYQADVYCEGCGDKVKKMRTRAGRPPLNPEDESTFDSDTWPKGPYDASEADTPQHCAACHVFLENPLTADGYRYVKEKLNALDGENFGDDETLLAWAAFYNFTYDPAVGWVSEEEF